MAYFNLPTDLFQSIRLGYTSFFQSNRLKQIQSLFRMQRIVSPSNTLYAWYIIGDTNFYGLSKIFGIPVTDCIPYEYNSLLIYFGGYQLLRVI